MIRAFALGLAIATTRLIEIPALIVLIMISNTGPTEQQFAPLVLVSFTLTFSLHAVLAEVWLRVSRRKRAPAAGAAQARAQGHADVVG
jgi:hypothetical protein